MTSYTKKHSGLTSANMLVVLTIIATIVAAIGLKSLSSITLSERPAEPRMRFTGRFRQERSKKPSHLRQRVSPTASRRR